MTDEVAYEICRVCGYIRPVGKGGRCEACGVRETAFVPFQHKASAKRRLYLEFDIHPVTVHFTTSFVITTAGVFFLSTLIPEILGIILGYKGILDLLVLLLPIFIVAGGATGLVDGKVRYRKLKTPYLYRKIILGSILFIISLIILIIHVFSNAGSDSLMVFIEALLLLLVAIIASYLGWIGSKLGCALVPRGKESP
ncbi:MAG: hypothetical protein ACXAC8_02950 [Candidatus Hodarchaeales archaeon]|jgi:hypothetical protein